MGRLLCGLFNGPVIPIRKPMAIKYSGVVYVARPHGSGAEGLQLPTPGVMERVIPTLPPPGEPVITRIFSHIGQFLATRVFTVMANTTGPGDLNFERRK